MYKRQAHQTLPHGDDIEDLKEEMSACLSLLRQGHSEAAFSALGWTFDETTNQVSIGVGDPESVEASVLGQLSGIIEELEIAGGDVSLMKSVLKVMDTTLTLKELDE